MSHVSSISIAITDLNALKLAAKELGANWIEGKKQYAWYGQHVGDYPLPQGMTEEQLGKCDHVISVPGVGYEVGVVRRADGTHTLAYDFYGPGRGLLKQFGEGLKKLVAAYSVHKTTLWARNKGYMVQRKTLNNGKTQLTVTGAGL